MMTTNDAQPGSASALRALATMAGVQTSYLDVTKVRRTASLEALAAILRELGLPLKSPADAPRILDEHKTGATFACLRRQHNIVAWDGIIQGVTLSLPVDKITDAVIELEDGDAVAATLLPNGRDKTGHVFAFAQPARLPIGYHRLRLQSKHIVNAHHVYAAPRKCYRPVELEPATGVFMPLYALQSQDDMGVADCTSFGRLARWASDSGCQYIGTLPLLAAFLGEPFEPSPYSPLSRLFWNELFIDPRDTPEFTECEQARALLDSSEIRSQVDSLHKASLVDYRQSMRIKRPVLEALADTAFRYDQRRHALEEFAASQPHLQDYAHFRAKVEHTRQAWQAWDDTNIVEEDNPEVTRSTRFHVYAQAVLQSQLRRVSNAFQSEHHGLYLDVPIGVNGGGYDAWRFQDDFAMNVSVGAPPDDFFTGGQNWGFPPMHPIASQQNGHSYFVAAIRNHMQFASLLRLDHVMALHRLFWIPQGMSAVDGVYVKYPADELYAVLCIESHRNRCQVVGENLGTVPASINDTLRRRNLLGMSIAQFEFSDEAEDAVTMPHSLQLAALNTHDMATFAGFWNGEDIDRRYSQGILDEDAADKERQRRDRTCQAVVCWLIDQGMMEDQPAVDAISVARALMEALGQSDASVVMINLEDLWGETLPQNVPGSGDEFPSWRRKARCSLQDIVSDSGFRSFLEGLRVKRLNDQQSDEALTRQA